MAKRKAANVMEEVLIEQAEVGGGPAVAASSAVADPGTVQTADADWDDEGESDEDDSADEISETLTPREDHEQLVAAAEAGTVIEFDPDELIADPTRNGRFAERKVTDQAVKELAGQIALEGQMQPGEVLYGLDNRLYVNYGVGRFLAVTLLNSDFTRSDKLPFKATVTLEQADDPAHALIRNAMENWGRLELTPLDKAKTVGMLLAAGLKQAQIVERLGLRKSTVSMYAAASAWPEEVKEAIAADRTSVKAVYDLGIKDPEKLAKEVGKLVTEAEQSGKGKATVSKAAANRSKREEKEETGKKKQRTPRQVIEFIESEATEATAKKYGDKSLPAKLTLFGKFINGMSEGTFLKNLAAL